MRIICKEGESLLQALRRAGYPADAPCGGMGRCGKCAVELEDGSTVAACRWVAKQETAVSVRSVRTDAASVLTEGREHFTGSYDPLTKKPAGPGLSFMAGVDIGTTTIAAYLLDAFDGRELAVTSCMNPQTAYGADVISRAQYVIDHGSGEVSTCIRTALREVLRSLAGEAGILTEQIMALCIAGNTCMHHLFLGLDVHPLVHAPYVPVMKEAAVLKAAEYGLGLHPETDLYMLPNIAGFVGADTVACLVSTRLDRQKEWTLLIDIGTNGEMVLGRDGKLAACSTAAGPAFEGAGISCGMRGRAGAISGASWEEDHWVLRVIGGGTPVGICGSGLLDLTAALLASGQMDEYGGLTRGRDVLLASGGGERTQGGEVRLTQRDIRQVQLAKAAIAAGVHCLADRQGIRVSDISRVWLAGAFGSFLNPDSACAIGLIPPELRGRIRSVGNASGAGTKCVLRSRREWERALELARMTEAVELANVPEFQDLFVDQMEFPAVQDGK